ncbi:SDR family NAD(P)-dependent oxidoreductase [Pararhizobium sp. IMCC21322]|uniref:SDR family NAD(P)-dependent oxidoreductase n=1 Tax=Pararhizobium sp. IMCC21322 TaxID=3067903 RepID=UPI002740E15D|nr:SDR family oxidoreductase [Pararhizobium sp. IMCC21322]
MLSSKNAMVTGAAGAIGRAAVKALVDMGAHVVLVDIDVGKLGEMASDFGDMVSAEPCDVGDMAAVQSVADNALKRLGHVDVLVNAAGILSNNKLETTEIDEWRRVFQINVESAFLLSRALVPSMANNGFGRVINISSYAAKCGGLTAGTAYTASKSAMTGLTFSIAREYAARGVTANAISPAYVMSPMVSEQLSAEQRDDLLSKIPVERFCTPDEVAHSIAYLASPLSGFITGEVIDMNGGLQFD